VFAMPAQKSAVIILGVGIIRLNIQRFTVMLTGQRDLTHALIQHGYGAVRRRVIAFLLQRLFQFRQRQVPPALLHVAHAQAGVVFGSPFGIFLGAVILRADGDTTGQQTGTDQTDNALPFHACTSPLAATCRRAWRRLRSLTLPASCPQAASISSPRVRRVIVIMRLASSTSRNRLITVSGERRYSVPGNGLKGIRFTLQGIPPIRRANSRACASESL